MMKRVISRLVILSDTPLLSWWYLLAIRLVWYRARYQRSQLGKDSMSISASMSNKVRLDKEQPETNSNLLDNTSRE